MHLGLEGKVAVVTGGTKGIGKCIVQTLLAEGAIVHFCARTDADVKAAEQEFNTQYPDTKSHGATIDITSPASLPPWLQSISTTAPRTIDILIANVSALAIPDTPANWHTTFATDMMGTYHFLHAGLPFLEASRGNIVVVNSVSGREIDFTAPGPYGTMKAGLVHYTAGLARTMAAKGVRVNGVAPGNILIPGGTWDRVRKETPEFFESQVALNPMGRMGTGEEVANAVVFLASNQRAGFICGANLVVDGSRCFGTQF